MINEQDRMLVEELQNSQPEIYDLIERITEDRNAVLSKASHNIKNIISIMGSSFQFISAQHPESENFHLWSNLEESISFITEFMEQTSLYRYSFYRVDSNIDIIDMLWSIPDFMDDIYEDMPEYHSRNFDFDFDPSLPIITGDNEKLRFAVIELVKNAFEATSDDDTIIISAHVVNDCLEISVKDNGCGISEENIDNLIEPFFSTKKLHTGVGLSIAYQVAVTHKGNLFISTNTDAVTTVTINIPLHV